jgi:hypothetical protein
VHFAKTAISDEFDVANGTFVPGRPSVRGLGTRFLFGWGHVNDNDAAQEVVLVMTTWRCENVAERGGGIRAESEQSYDVSEFKLRFRI